MEDRRWKMEDGRFYGRRYMEFANAQHFEIYDDMI